MPETHDLSLVITAHRGGQMLDACLDSAAALEPAPREVIVAIDGDDELVVKKAASLRRDRHRFAQAFSGSTKWSRRGDSNP